jgi:tetratricopeptide (TPR) repeat protein
MNGRTLKNRARLLEITIFAAIILLLAAGTYYRNRIWGSQMSLWRDSAKKSPEKDRPSINLSAALMREGRYEEAIYELRQTLKKFPRSAEAMNNLGTIYTLQGRTEEAEKMFFDVIKVCGSGRTGKEAGIIASAHNNLGVIMAKKGAMLEAVAHFKEALDIRPDFEEAKRNFKLIQGGSARK